MSTVDALMNERAASSPAESLVDRAVRAVREYIRLNDLKVGDPLPGEAHFATSVGVSRAVIREAFGALAALRLIDVGNGRRARVNAMDGAVMAASLDHAVTTAQISLVEIWDVRRTLEQRTASLAASNRTREEADAIMFHADAMVRANGDRETITRHDIAFHEAIARASHNALLVQIVSSFAPLMTRAVPAAWETRAASRDRSHILEQHLRLARAIADGDPRAAEEAMIAHFDTAIDDQLRARER